MVKGNSFNFACPWCGQRFEVEYDMAGMAFDCPTCGKPFKVPRIDNIPPKGCVSHNNAKPNQPPSEFQQPTVNSGKKRLKVFGIGFAVLLVLVGIGVVTVISRKHAAVTTSIECLLNCVEIPTERRLGVLSKSLESCPGDFSDAVRDFLISVSRTSDDMISDREREDMIKGKIALGLIFGAVNQNDPQSGVTAGLQLGDLLSAKAREECK